MRPIIRYSTSDASIRAANDVWRLSEKVCTPTLKHDGAEDVGRVCEKGDDLHIWLVIYISLSIYNILLHYCEIRWGTADAEVEIRIRIF